MTTIGPQPNLFNIFSDVNSSDDRKLIPTTPPKSAADVSSSADRSKNKMPKSPTKAPSMSPPPGNPAADVSSSADSKAMPITPTPPKASGSQNTASTCSKLLPQPPHHPPSATPKPPSHPPPQRLYKDAKKELSAPPPKLIIDQGLWKDPEDSALNQSPSANTASSVNLGNYQSITERDYFYTNFKDAEQEYNLASTRLLGATLKRDETKLLVAFQQKLIDDCTKNPHPESHSLQEAMKQNEITVQELITSCTAESQEEHTIITMLTKREQTPETLGMINFHKKSLFRIGQRRITAENELKAMQAHKAPAEQYVYNLNDSLQQRLTLLTKQLQTLSDEVAALHIKHDQCHEALRLAKKAMQEWSDKAREKLKGPVADVNSSADSEPLAIADRDLMNKELLEKIKQKVAPITSKKRPKPAHFAKRRLPQRI